MKPLFARILLVCFFSSWAVASKINLDARTEMESYSSNTAVGKPAYSVFKINRMKLDFSGNLGELNSFRIRVDVLKVGDTTATKTKRDNVASYLDVGYITHRLSDEFNVSMGKIITGMGGAEALNNPGDIYLRSLAGEEIANIYWPVGMQAQHQFGDQKINLNVANITEDITDNAATPNLTNTSHLYGLAYLGKLSKGSIQPSISYHTETFNNTMYTKKTNNYAALGARFLVSDFEIEVDALNNTRKYEPKGAEKLGDVTSGVALVRYTMETGSVHFKYENSSVKVPTGVDVFAKSKVTGLTLGYEYKPVKDDNWQFHVVGTQRDTKPDGAVTRSEKKVFAGMRIIADFLK